jgi:hypothetical protein
VVPLGSGLRHTSLAPPFAVHKDSIDLLFQFFTLPSTSLEGTWLDFTLIFRVGKSILLVQQLNKFSAGYTSQLCVLCLFPYSVFKGLPTHQKGRVGS